MEKDRKMIRLKDLPSDQRVILDQQYPYGNYLHDSIKINIGKRIIHALVFETESIIYLIKVSNKKAKIKAQSIEGLSYAGADQLKD